MIDNTRNPRPDCNRRAFLARLGAGALPLARLGAASTRPNIVLFLADDLGFGDIASYGAPDIRTPNIDSIGRRGVRFTSFYTNGPECSPTRSALMTGRYQQRIGGLECAIGVGNVGRYDEAEWLAGRGELGLPLSEYSLPRALKDAGYDTACFGKWHLGYGEKFSPNRHGFDEYFGIMGGGSDYFTHIENGSGDHGLYQNEKPVKRTGYTTDLFVDEAIAWLKRRKDKPFFLYLPFNAPHTPIQDPDGYDPKTGSAPVRQGHRPTYAKMVEREDKRIGDVLAQLDAMGVSGNTFVIFHSDNGGDANGRNDPYRGKKGSLWEGGIHVPCEMRWPGVLPEGKTISRVTLTMDIMPTLLAAAGVQPPAGRRFDGVDLLPVLTGRRPQFSRSVFWRFKRGTRVAKAAREGDLKLILDSGKEELYDLSRDEREQTNLLPGAAEAAASLRTKLAAWEREVMAPRLRPFRSEPG